MMYICIVSGYKDFGSIISEEYKTVEEAVAFADGFDRGSSYKIYQVVDADLLIEKAKRADKAILRRAKILYADYTDSDPVVHSNRFPSWNELSDKSKEEWIGKAKGIST
jgi:hypothetical protein